MHGAQEVGVPAENHHSLQVKLEVAKHIISKISGIRWDSKPTHSAIGVYHLLAQHVKLLGHAGANRFRIRKLHDGSESLNFVIFSFWAFLSGTGIHLAN